MLRPRRRDTQRGNTLAKRPEFRFNEIHKFLQGMFEEDIHAKRVYSLAHATLGLMTGASLAVHAIGQARAQARGLLSQQAIKQVERLLSNEGIVVWEMFAQGVPEGVGQRKAIGVAMDWTEFECARRSGRYLAGESPAGVAQARGPGASLAS